MVRDIDTGTHTHMEHALHKPEPGATMLMGKSMVPKIHTISLSRLFVRGPAGVRAR